MKKLTPSDFILRALELYGTKYDFSKVVFVNTSTKVCITCSEHGDFWMTPNNFLHNHKCPACSGRERVTRAVFISRSTVIHGNRYDYSNVDYHGLQKAVCIKCPIHGEFWQKPALHLNHNGCQKCFATPKSSATEFAHKAKALYGEKYDYSRVEYKGNKTKVCIVCPEHGEWWMSPNNHLRGHECPICYGTPKHTLEGFIEKARAVHGSKYDYSRIEYKGNKAKVCIVCPQHGEFWQSAGSHLRGNGCAGCSGTAPVTHSSFISRATKIHEGKYDYSDVIYTSRKNKVCITCPEHGSFWQNPHFHLQGGGCPRCTGSVRLTTAEFVEKARAVHDDRYDYSKVNYTNTATKVCMTCPEHGDFWQTPNNHLFGAGCPTCPQSNLEGAVRQLLIRNEIEFEQEKGFDWLVFNRRMFLDFFLPEYGIGIECQGGQHFFPSRLFGGEDYFRLTVERDRVKRNLCNQHGITLLFYSNCHIDYPYPVFESLRLLLKAIRQHGVVDATDWEEQFKLPFLTGGGST